MADQATDAVQRTREAIDEAAKQGRRKAREIAEKAQEHADESRAAAAEALHDASSTLHKAADKAPGAVRDAAHSAAEGLDRTARYVEDTAPGEMVGDLLNVVRRHPVPSLLVAAGVGFIVARSMRRD